MKRRSTSTEGLALIESVVVLLVVGIVAATAVLIVGGIHTKPVNHACWDEAQRFQTLVRDYKHLHHGAVPSVKESRRSKPDAVTASLVMMRANKETGFITTSHNGDAPDQWKYDASRGVVAPGRSCS